MRRAPIQPAGHAVEHVADVADEGILDRRRLDPAGGGAHLQAADAVLAQQRQEAIVGVLADAVAHVKALGHGPARVEKDPEQDQRIGGVAAREVVLGQFERAGDAGHDPMAERGHRRHPGRDRLAEPGQHVVAGNEVAAVQRHAGADPRMVVAELAAEIEPFLPVGPARGQLAAEREPAAPGAAAERHGEALLRFLGEGEEAMAEVFEPRPEPRIDAVADDVEEAVRPAGVADGVRDRLGRGTQVDPGQAIHRPRS